MEDSNFLDYLSLNSFVPVTEEHSKDDIVKLHNLFGEVVEADSHSFVGAFVGGYDEYNHGFYRPNANSSRQSMDTVLVLVLRIPAWERETKDEIVGIATGVQMEDDERKRQAELAEAEAQLAKIDDERAALRLRVAQLRQE